MRSAKNGSSGKDYEEFVTSRGVNLQVFPVPQKIVSAVIPKKPKPRRPEVEMAVAKGPPQKRFMKAGDPGWDAYQEGLEAWEEEKDALQEAITFCLALKTFPYPADLTFSPEIQELADAGLLNIPDDPYVRKFMWIRENLLGQHDELQITWIVNKLSGVPEEMIEQMKDSFRRAILGETANGLGNIVEAATIQQSEEDNSN